MLFPSTVCIFHNKGCYHPLMNWLDQHERNLGIIASYKDGYTMKQVAARHNCNLTTVTKVLRDAAAKGLVTIRPRGLPDGTNRNRVNEATALTMREHGATYQQIGDTLGVSRQRVFQIVQRAGKEARRG